MKQFALSILFFLFYGFCANAQIYLQLPKEQQNTTLPEMYFYENGNLKLMEKAVQNKKSYVFKTPKTRGFYEIKIGEVGKIPFVFTNQEKIYVTPSLEDIENYTVSSNDSENLVLKDFLKEYKNYLNLIAETENTLKQNWQTEGQKNAVVCFINEYIKIRKDNSIQIERIIKEFPESYTSNYLAPLLLPTLPQENETDLLSFFHKNYFSNWNLSSDEALNNPIIMDEFKMYLTFFATKSGSLEDALNIIMSHKDLINNLHVKEKLIELVSLKLIELQHPKAEEYAIYLNDNFNQACPDEALATTTNKNFSLATRIKNMKIGKQWPVMKFELLDDLNKNPVEVGVKKDKKVVLYFWRSTCEHCKATSKEVENLAAQNLDIEFVSVSLDKDKEHLLGYLKYIKETEKRNRPINWKECWESNGFESEQLKQVYISGTPLFIILNEEGIVTYKGHTIDQLKLM